MEFSLSVEFVAFQEEIFLGHVIGDEVEARFISWGVINEP